MGDTRKRRDRMDIQALQSYFAEEISDTPVPPPPSLSNVQAGLISYQGRIRHVFAAIITAAAFALLILTAGKGTTLSAAMETVFSRYDVGNGITGVIIEAGKIYRSEL